MDDSIKLLFTLFVLSVVSERIANFLKLQLSCFTILKKQIIGNTRIKSLVKEDEKIRELRILKINIICGLITAIAVNADFINMVNHLSNLDTSIGWGNSNTNSLLVQILGFILTGMFLSLGSKFWHDLLDVLLQIKNAKSLINDQTGKNLSFGSFGSLPSDTQNQLINSAIRDNYASWNSQYNITGASNASKNNSNPVQRSIVFQVQKKLPNNSLGNSSIPSAVYYGGYQIPTDVVEAGATVAHSYIDSPPCDLGVSIGRIRSNNNPTNNTGTLGLKIYSPAINSYYLLSCYHVLFANELNSSPPIYSVENQQKIVGDASVIIPGPLDCDPNSQNIVGKAFLGYLNQQLDIGLAQLTADGISSNVHGIGKVTYSTLNNTNMLGKTVQICGRTTSPSQTGSIISEYSSQLINYSDFGFNQALQGLIQISPVISAGGDSGAPVVDSEDNLIGIIVGGDGMYSYAIPITTIIYNLPINLKIDEKCIFYKS